jgi:hypothetical protein
VSILITIGDVAGGVRGVPPRWNLSMMTMRPPQHGHGCVVGLDPLASAPLVSAASRRHVEQAARSGDVAGARAAGEQAIVADAVEALRGRTWIRNRRMNSPMASVMTF